MGIRFILNLLYQFLFPTTKGFLSFVWLTSQIFSQFEQMTSFPVFLSQSAPLDPFILCLISGICNLSPPSFSTDFLHIKLFGLGLKLFMTLTFLFLFYLSGASGPHPHPCPASVLTPLFSSLSSHPVHLPGLGTSHLRCSAALLCDESRVHHPSHRRCRGSWTSVSRRASEESAQPSIQADLRSSSKPHDDITAVCSLVLLGYQANEMLILSTYIAGCKHNSLAH